MSPDAILALKPSEYALLFGRVADLQSKYRALLLTWHPDRNHDPKASAVSAHINVLHAEARKAQENGTWSEPNVARVVDGARQFEFRYQRNAATPAGEIFIGKTRVMVTAGAGMDDLCDHALKVMRGLPPAPGKLRDELGRLLPILFDNYQPAGRRGYMLAIDPRAIRLRDLLDRGPLDPKHAAWVLSGAYNVACYLDFAGITHLGIGADHIFITPETHEVSLLAGWEFASAGVGKPVAAPPAAITALGSALSANPSDRRHNLSLIRALGRECLGDPSGASLTIRSDVPRPFARWLQLPAGKSAQAEYAAWGKCLEESFGPRRFLKLPTTHRDVYGD